MKRELITIYAIFQKVAQSVRFFVGVASPLYA